MTTTEQLAWLSNLLARAQVATGAVQLAPSEVLLLVRDAAQGRIIADMAEQATLELLAALQQAGRHLRAKESAPAAALAWIDQALGEAGYHADAAAPVADPGEAVAALLESQEIAPAAVLAAGNARLEAFQRLYASAGMALARTTVHAAIA